LAFGRHHIKVGWVAATGLPNPKPAKF
jgi:hypothetical protein